MFDITERAFRAYFRSAGDHAAQPSKDADFFTVKDKEYVVLSNIRGILACYRIRPNGTLRRLARYPREVAEAY